MVGLSPMPFLTSALVRQIKLIPDSLEIHKTEHQHVGNSLISQGYARYTCLYAPVTIEQEV